ncbi:hypothetical protein F4808DRAFT_407337 [Astrocystis sublimbata]|nr:hypothetical protein F4808DRAFT_407337 [Astrocystis sublimbata]
MADYSKMKVVELKAELKRLGLPQNGLKAELVSRLEEAAADEGSPADGDVAPPAEATASTEPDEAQPSAVAEPADDDDSPEPLAAETTQELPAESATDLDTAQPGSSNDDEQQQVPAHTTASEAVSPSTADVAQDVPKRKRRSTTPPPDSDEIARKRMKQDDADVTQSAIPDAASDESAVPAPVHQDTNEVAMSDVDTGATHQNEPTDTITAPVVGEDVVSEAVANGAEEDNTLGATANLIDNHPEGGQDSLMLDAREATPPSEAHPALGDSTGQAPRDRDTEQSLSPERDVEPSIHPATCALYIKNFMRPLRPQAVKEHLLELATPANAPLDSSTITSFYLDNIRTHAFAVFTSVSAASRVRTALHQRIWPDETNRKALWIDFIPDEVVEDWIELEQQARNAGNMPRYEVVYEHEHDGTVLAKLEEADANQAAAAAARRAPASPVAKPERRNSIPTGPSRPSGIENAPTGPRNPYAHNNGPANMYPGRPERIDPGFVKTEAGPPVLYRPVTSELAQRRLDILANAKDPRYSYDEPDKAYHRYYFERDDHLVNRGPEIFLGIRPPHREKERQMGRAGGGPPPDPRDRFRDRRGPLGPPGGSNGRRRRRGPRPHGVPRGGDRFRPGGGPSFDDRAPMDDRFPPRREGYGGGGGGGGGGGRRNDRY